MATYTISVNNNFNSLEISFTEKPSEAIREVLKSYKFRWNPKKSIWYGFADVAELENALENGITKIINKSINRSTSDEKQKELFNIFMNEIKKVWSTDDMIKHCKNNCDYVVELANGHIYEIEKPRIEKNFCFGYGMYARSTDEEQQQASEMAHYAATNESYFFTENMEQITRQIESYKEVLEGKKEAYKFLKYSGMDESDLLYAVNVCTIGNNPEFSPYMWSNCKNLEKLTMEEVNAIIEGLEIVKAKFEKRLKTYLKKYGLSKVNTWSYLRD